MILVLSPSKTLDFQSSFSTPALSQPIFFEDSRELVESLNSMTQTEIAQLMKISAPLAELNVQRYREFSFCFTPQNSKPALTSFRGDVYRAFERENLTIEDYTFAQKHIRILSGLYGILKPLDGIQPYRLEMGTKLVNSRGKNLYDYWKQKVTTHLAQTLQEEEQPILLNLASQEYISVIDLHQLGGAMITITFKEERPGRLKVIGINAKRARGMMACWIVKNQIDSPEKLFNFSEDGYRYQSHLSSESEYVFVR
jgi:cytoplasmic iron level regulating protein YaaA (DUF328/UPF0246 family)